MTKLVPVRNALVAELLRLGSDDVVRAVVPSLAKIGSNAVAHQAQQLAGRADATADLLCQCVTQMASWEVSRFLRDHAELPDSVLAAVVTRWGRTPQVITEVARRRDLSEAVALSLTRRSSRRVLAALRDNETLHPVARWRVSGVVSSALGRAAARPRIPEFITGALVVRALCATGSLVVGPAPSVARSATSYALSLHQEVFRLAPTNPRSAAERRVVALIGVAMANDPALSWADLARWAARRPCGAAAEVLLSLAQRLPVPESGSGDDRFRTSMAERLSAVVVRGPDAVRRWRDDASVTAAFAAGGVWRRLALASGALPEHVACEVIATTDDADDLAALAANPSLPPSVVSVLVTTLPTSALHLLRSAPLSAEQRMQLLVGAGGSEMAGVIARGLGQAVRPGWLDGWWTRDLAIAALDAVGVSDRSSYSVIGDEIVRCWPDELDRVLAGISLSHQIGPTVTTAMAERIAALSPDAAAVVGTLISDWKGSLAELAAAAQML